MVLRGHSVYPIQNTHESPEHNFRLSLDEVDAFLEEHSYSDVIGIYHSHPNNAPFPSREDIAGWPRGQGLRYWIVTQYLVTEWEKV